MAGSRIDLEAELDRLFALKLDDFVSARNALAARLRTSGDAAAADRVNELPKPSAPAWGVNQLRFAAPRVLADLLAAGDRLRSRPSDTAGAMQARREAVAAARKKAGELLAQGGHAATPQTMRRVSSTLEALATYGNAPNRAMKRAGRLTEDLPSPGFDDLAALGILPGRAASTGRRAAPMPARVPRSPAASPRVAQKIEATRAREEAARAKALLAHKQKLVELRAKLAALEKDAARARKTRQELETALASASHEERRNRDAADAAKKAVEAAERAASAR